MNKQKVIKRKRHQQYVARNSLKKRRRGAGQQTMKIKHPSVTSVHHTPKQHFVKKVTATQHVAQILEYDILFGSKEKPSIDELLSQVPRETALMIAGAMNNIYGEADLDKLERFFASDSYNNREEISQKLNAYFEAGGRKLKLFWATNETPSQLMRYAFAYPFDKIRAKALSNEEAEMIIFKIILLINQEHFIYHIKKEDQNIENMLFLLSAMNVNMQGQNDDAKKDRSIMQLYFAVEFFTYFEKQENYKALYEAFLKKHGIVRWEEYIRSVFGIVAMLNYRAGLFDKELKNDTNHLISKSVLESLSRPYYKDIKFKSDGPADRDGNTDYKAFRDRPITQIANDYHVFNWEFMIDGLYNALYFEFKELPVSKRLQDSVQGIFTDKFAEKQMFDKLMLDSASKRIYTHYTEDDLGENYKPKKGELGPPDYMLESNEDYILFECKDVRIGGDEIESHDFDTILDIYSNKLFQKRWRYVNGEKVYFKDEEKANPDKKKEKRIGITQLTEHISNIRQGKFNYANTDSQKGIYPVLILSDYKYIHRGFTRIANKWYRKALGELISDSQKRNRPLIVMSFMTLIEYHDLFIKNGFEYYFEQYYKVYYSPQYNFDSAVEANMSFDDFMKKNPFDLTPIHKRLMDVIRRGI